MTPEEAKPRTGADAHNDLLYENIGRGKFPPWFTAKEAAEIAQAYCRDYINSTIPYQKGVEHLQKAIAWQNLFEGWSK